MRDVLVVDFGIFVFHAQPGMVWHRNPSPFMVRAWKDDGDGCYSADYASVDEFLKRFSTPGDFFGFLKNQRSLWIDGDRKTAGDYFDPATGVLSLCVVAGWPWATPPKYAHGAEIGEDATIPGPVETAMQACELLVAAYRQGLEGDGSVEWSDVDEAHALARQALGLPAEDGSALNAVN